MERLRLLYEQIEEAKRLMMTGTEPNLRLSLILLDNAAQLVMYRELEYRFAFDDALRRIGSSRKKTEHLYAEVYG
jgi:hypothetical protein